MYVLGFGFANNAMPSFAIIIVMHLSMSSPTPDIRAVLVGRSPTNCVGLGTTAMSGFVPLQKFCSPIRLQSSSAEGVAY